MANTIQGLGAPLTFKRAGELGLGALAQYAQLAPEMQQEYRRDLEVGSRRLEAGQAKTGALGARSGAFQSAELQRGLMADAEGRRMDAAKALTSAGLQAEGYETQKGISGAEIASREKIAGQQLEFERGSFAETMNLKRDQLEQDASLFRENLNATKENIKTQQDWQSAESVLERQFKEGILSTEQAYDASKQMIQNAFEQGIVDQQMATQMNIALEDRKLKRDSLAQDATLFRENLDATMNQIQAQGDVQEALLLVRQQGEMGILDRQQQFESEMAVLKHARDRNLLSMKQVHDAEQKALDRAQRELDREQKASELEAEREEGLFSAIGEFAGSWWGQSKSGDKIGGFVDDVVGGTVDFIGSLFGGGE